MPAAFGGVSALAVPAEEIRKNMQRLSKPQTKALAAFSFGIAKAEGCGLNAAAKRLPLVGKSRGGRARDTAFHRQWRDRQRLCGFPLSRE